ncbi:MAG: FAD-binding oxidoreductase [Bacteroidetes bacterium]|nr:FAD-binding oxidoreductase [Bacteroidota bacterium]
MQKNNFLIIGNGLAGTVLAHTLKQHQISFSIIANKELSKSSWVAGGLWNPVVFKRYTKSWMADVLLSEMKLFYQLCEKKHSAKYYYELPLLKPLANNDEIKFWNKASDFNNYLHDQLILPEELCFKNIQHPMAYGLVKETGRINLERFLTLSHSEFASVTTNETFDYNEIIINENDLVYKNNSYCAVIFCEGHLMTSNPLFNKTMLKPAKGELLELENETIDIKNYIITKNSFLFNLEANKYICGATYEWDDLTDHVTEKAKHELLKKAALISNTHFKITKQLSGVRPSSVDRRPIIGQHPVYKNIYAFNGLGTKGVMLAPYFAKHLTKHIINGEKLMPEVNLNRFYL